MCTCAAQLLVTEFQEHFASYRNGKVCQIYGFAFPSKIGNDTFSSFEVYLLQVFWRTGTSLASQESGCFGTATRHLPSAESHSVNSYVSLS